MIKFDLLMGSLMAAMITIVCLMINPGLDFKNNLDVFLDIAIIAMICSLEREEKK